MSRASCLSLLYFTMQHLTASLVSYKLSLPYAYIYMYIYIYIYVCVQSGGTAFLLTLVGIILNQLTATFGSRCCAYRQSRGCWRGNHATIISHVGTTHPHTRRVQAFRFLHVSPDGCCFFWVLLVDSLPALRPEVPPHLAQGQKAQVFSVSYVFLLEQQDSLGLPDARLPSSPIRIDCTQLLPTSRSISLMKLPRFCATSGLGVLRR